MPRGRFGSSANAASGRAVVSWFGPDQRGFALGLRHMATPLGGATAAALLPLAAHRGGRRGGDAGPRRRHAWRGARPPPSGLRRAGAEPGELDEPPAHDGRPAARPRDLAPVAGHGGVVLAQISVLSFLALYLHEERGWSVAAAALALAAVQLGGAAARVAAGIWSDRLGSRIRPLRALALAGAVALARRDRAPAGARRRLPCRS